MDKNISTIDLIIFPFAVRKVTPHLLHQEFTVYDGRIRLIIVMRIRFLLKSTSRSQRGDVGIKVGFKEKGYPANKLALDDCQEVLRVSRDAEGKRMR